MSVLTECELEDTAKAIHLFSPPHSYPFIFFPTSLSFFSYRYKDTLFNLSPSKKDLHAPSWSCGGEIARTQRLHGAGKWWANRDSGPHETLMKIQMTHSMLQQSGRICTFHVRLKRMTKGLREESKEARVHTKPLSASASTL